MRYPFKHYANRLICAYAGVYSDNTLTVIDRRLRVQSRSFIRLKEEGKVSTTDPRHMTIDDIKEFYLTLKERNLSSTSITHELSTLHLLCTFANGNQAVSQFKIRFPQARGRKRHKRLPRLPAGVRDSILRNADNLRNGDYLSMRAYALVIMSIGSGARTIELIHAKMSDLNLSSGVLHLDIVKGADLFGESRDCPILPDCVPHLTRYIEERTRYLDELKISSDHLFPGPKGEPLSGQSVRRYKEWVALDSDSKFDYRTCRRDYAQTLIDMGVSLDSVALVMGHTSTRMTEKNYARKSSDDALKDVFRAVNSSKLV